MKLGHELRKAARVFIIGNGGSYSNSIHICNDFLAVGIKACTLDPATLTASANDFGYETVFSRWIATCGAKGDWLIALSGSGRSPNIGMAVSAAKWAGMSTIGVFGAYNDKQIPVDICVQGGDTMQEAEEHQIAWGHEVMLSLKDAK